MSIDWCDLRHALGEKEMGGTVGIVRLLTWTMTYVHGLVMWPVRCALYSEAEEAGTGGGDWDVRRGDVKKLGKDKARSKL